MIRDLQADLRAAIADRDAMAAKLADLRARQAETEAEAVRAEQAALEAKARHVAALGADDASRAGVAKAEKSAATERFDELVITAQALAERAENLEREHAALARGAAYARERVAVAIAGQREIELRAASKVFAQIKAGWHRAAASAAEARYAATGHVGVEPVPHTGFKHSVLATAHDDGLLALFAREGIAPNLTPVNIRGMSESELLQFESADPAPKEKNTHV